MATSTLTAALRHVVTETGMRPGTHLENQVALMLHHCGLHPAQQYQVGRYRLDFAWPGLRIALEADGWHHRAPEGAAKDRARDSWLRSQGWVIFRVDDEHGEPSLRAQVGRVAQLVTDVQRAAMSPERIAAARERAAVKVRCPHCGQPAGKECRTVTSNLPVIGSHRDRLEAGVAPAAPGR